MIGGACSYRFASIKSVKEASGLEMITFSTA